MSIQTYTLEELLALKPPAWLVEGVIPELGLVALYGSPGDGKSFLALDMALSIASGVPWQGHQVQKGFVVYISAEGGAGLGKRVGAWLAHQQILPEEYQFLLLNFVTSAVRVNPDSEDLGEILAQTVHQSAYQELLANVLDPDESGPPLFIVVDTLARCFEGDENQQEDMGIFIKGLDYLRESYQATVLVIHHTNKNGFEERGSSSFRGACDTMMLAKKEDTTITLSCEKQKDAEPFENESFELTVVETWNSCVVESARGAIEAKKARILHLLAEYGPFTFDEWLGASELPKTTFYRYLTELRKNGQIVKENEHWSVSGPTGKEPMEQESSDLESTGY